jgi:hypothetical protein
VDVLYNRPDGRPVVLRRQPVLAGSDTAQPPPPGPELRAYLDGLVADLDWTSRPGDRLALQLDVGLPSFVPLLARGHDLDDYLFPVVGRLGPIRFDAVFATKRPGIRSTIRVAPATAGDEAPPAPLVSVRTTESATSIDWKQQVHDACRDATPAVAPSGGVAVELRFTLSRRRNWAALWKPALDSLGPILGVPDPTRPYRADVGRVTALALHRRFDDTLGHRVLVETWWRRDPLPPLIRRSP